MQDSFKQVLVRHPLKIDAISILPVIKLCFDSFLLRAQLATITATKSNSVLSQKHDYIASLEQIHAESLASATDAQKSVYQQAQDLLT